MKILNNATNIEVGATSENYLKTVQYKQPEFNKMIIQQYGAIGMYPIVETVLGAGMIYTKSQARTGYQEIGADSLAWPVMPNQTNTTYIRAWAYTPGTSTADNVARNISFQDGWMTAGMEVLIPMDTGDYQKFYLVDSGTLTAGLYVYSTKFIASDTSTTVGTPQYGLGASATKVSVFGNIVSDKALKGSLTPTQPADLYENFTKIHRYQLEVSRSEAQSKIWYVGENGEKTWSTQKEHQFRQYCAGKLEMSAWYDTRTYQTVAGNFYSVNTPYLTDAAGNTLKSGDGIFAQIETGFTTTFSYAQMTNPLNYNLAVQGFQDTLTNWQIVNGITTNTELIAYTGTAGYAWWQNVFKQFADQSGGGISLEVSDFDGGRKITLNTKAYNFGGTTIHLRKCVTFDNPEMQTNSVTQGSNITYSGMQFVMMPMSTNEGYPVIEARFKGGEGFDGGFFEILMPGTLNPMAPGGMNTNAPTGSGELFDGYQLQVLTEVMFNVPNPKLIQRIEWTV